jgi:hypothetical protein
MRIFRLLAATSLAALALAAYPVAQLGTVQATHAAHGSDLAQIPDPLLHGG